MNALIGYIDFLLKEHDCVIVPKLGGFIVNRHPACSDGYSHFKAPYCDIVFNDKLTYDDGLLANSIMKIHKISFEKACARIEVGVSEMKKKLLSGETVNFKNWGQLILSEESFYRFIPNKSESFVNPDYFGLNESSFAILLNSHEVKKKKEKSEKSSSFLYKLSSAAACIIVLLCSLLLVDNSNHSSLHEAGLADIILQQYSGSDLAKFSNSDHKEKEIALSTNSSTPKMINNDRIEKFRMEEKNTGIGEKKYHIIIAVFNTQHKTEIQSELLREEGFSSVNVIKRNNRFFISSNSFSSEDEALQCLKKIKKESKHSDAWILKY